MSALHGLKLTLPPAWQSVQIAKKPPPGYGEAHWLAPGGKEFTANYWAKLPPTAGGVMVAAREWDCVVAGQKTKLIQTSVFQGVKAAVWVVFLRRGESHYRLWARGATRAEFQTILASAAWE